MELPKYLRAGDVAKALNCSHRHVLQLCQEGLVPSIRIGQAYRIPEVEFREWLAKGGVRREKPAA